MGVDSGYGYGTSVRTTTRTTTTRSNRAASAALRASAAKNRATTAARTAAVGARAAGISGVKSAVFNNPYVQRNAAYAAQVNGPRDRYSQSTVDAFNNTIGAITGTRVGRNPGIDPVAAALTFAPFGAIGRLGKYVIPEALRIASAATRVSSRARRAGAVAEAAVRAGEWDINEGIRVRNIGLEKQSQVLGGNVNTYSFRGHGAFDENLGYDLASREFGVGVREGEDLVRRGFATKEYAPGGNTWIYRPTGGTSIVNQGETQIAAGRAAVSAGQRAAELAASRASTRAATAELKRRLAALRAARNR